MNTKNIFKLIAITFLTFVISACDNNASNDMSVSRVNYINAVNGSASSQVFLDGVKMNTTALNFRGQRGYTNTDSGTKTVELKMLATPYTSYVSGSVTFGDFKDYTVFFTGSTTAPTATVETVLVEDNLASPANGKFKVRLANMVANTTTGSLEITPVFTAYVKATNLAVSPAETCIGTTYPQPSSPVYTTIFSTVAYKSVTDFTQVDYAPAAVPTHTDNTKIFKLSGYSIRTNVGGTPHVATNTSIAPGRIVTIVATGTPTSYQGTVFAN